MASQTHQMTFDHRTDPTGRTLCVRCIGRRLTCCDGVQAARVINSGDSPDEQTVVELEYDPGVTYPDQIERSLAEDKGCMCGPLAKLILPIQGLHSPKDEYKVQTILEGIDGLTASVSFDAQAIEVEFDRSGCSLAEVVRRLDRLGIRVQSTEEGARQASQEESDTSRPTRVLSPWLVDALRDRELVFCLIGGVFLVAGAVIHWAGGPGYLRIALLAVSYVACGWGTAVDVVKTLLRLRFDIDVLMFLAAVGAAVLGHYEEGALLLLLFGLGGAGESLAMQRARGAIEALTSLAPQTATLIDESRGQREVPVRDLRVGDLVLVRPGQRICADGRVVGGRSVVDQSPITGESVPVEKSSGDGTYAGTINGDGALTVEVTTPSEENTIAKVIRLVEEAQASQSPTQLFTKQVEKWYVPFVLVTTATLIVLPPLLAIQPARDSGLWSGWFYQAMAFLTAASPCALAIGTPAAVLSGIGRAARGGVLVKGGAYLETLGRIRAIAFDKTGTLTAGRHEVTDVVCMGTQIDQSRLLGTAAALEGVSNHPLATAVVAEAHARQVVVPEAVGVQQISGMGVRGEVEGQGVVLGRWSMVREHATKWNDQDLDNVQRTVEQLELRGRTVIAVGSDGGVLGLVALIDQPRPNAAAMINALHRLGVRETVMLTGDNPRTAAEVAKQVGIDQWHAGLLPQDKVDRVDELNHLYGQVAMVGDGVNDAPALATAAVGVAMGGATGGGSDVALETADVVLLANDLTKVPQAIGVSRFARKIITQNLVIALGVIAVLAPAAALGYTTIYAAVLFHEGSTVLVVLNGLRILGYRDPV